MPYDRIALVSRVGGERLAAVPAVRGQTVYAAFERMGLRLPTKCRGSAICGLCRVEVRSGAVEPAQPAPDERALLDRVALDEPDARLACRLMPVPGEPELVLAIDATRWRRFRPSASPG